ncbi:MAG: hypothetical protein J6B94_09350 [Lachnospiraceae bacterium]|nr:hypothetical protein [Lachnospiraceae bacterium]
MSTIGCGKVIGYEKMAEKLLNEKYNDEFVVEDIQSASILDEYYTALAYQKDHPDTIFKVYVNNDGSGVSDNYVNRLVCAQLSDTVARNLDSLNGIYYIYSSTLIDSLELEDPYISLSEYVDTHPKMKYNIYVFYSPDISDKENLYQGLTSICQGLSISGNIYLYIMDDSVLKDVQDYLENNDKIYDDGDHMFEPYFCGIMKFTNGVLDNSKDEVFEMIEGK